MGRWFSTVSACGLLGLCVLGSPVAYGQVEADPFNVPEGVVADDEAADGATNGDTAATTPSTTQPRTQSSMFGFGLQLTPEQLEQVDQIYADGTELASNGDLNGALQKFAEALSINNQHYPSYYSRGLIEIEQGFTERAIQSLGTAITLNPRSYELYLERGKAYMDAERYRNAIQDFQTAQSLNYGDAEILYWLGQAQAEFGYSQILGSARQENFEAAVASFDLALRLREDYPEVLFERGSARLQLGLVDDALDDLQRAVELDPDNPEAAAQLGFASLQRASTESLRRNGQRALIIADYQNSVEALTKYFSLLPPDIDEEEEQDEDDIRRENVYVARAMALNGLGDEFTTDSGDELSDRSRDYYRNAILDAEASAEIEPDLPSPFFQKGLAQRMLGDFESAIDSFTEALERNPVDTESMLRRGIVFFRQGEFGLARTDFLAAARLRINPRASFWAGLAYAKLGDYKQAIVAYNTALRYQTTFPIAHLNRGLAHMKVGRFERAIADFNEVLRSDRHNEDVRLLRSQAQQLFDES